MQSKFTYDLTSTFINSLTTPYGTTSFSQYTKSNATDIWRGLKFNFPDGTSSLIENWLRHETKSYFWSRQQLGLYPNDPANLVYTHCEISKCMVSPLTFIEMPVIAWVKKPLEGLILYTYPNQSVFGDFYFVGNSNDPIQVNRVMDDGSQQNYFYEYGDFGNVTKSTDPVGRVFEYRYAANNIDLLEKRMTRSGANDLLSKTIFNNSQHLPNISIDGSGQRTVYTYNAAGQPLTVTDSNNNVTTMTYNGNGYLTQIDGPLPGSSDITTIAFDGYGRVYTVTDSVGYVITYSYDNFDRVTQITYPDGTNEQNIYNKLDKVMSKDRNGRWTEYAFDNMQQMVYEKDPLGRKTQYVWCDCGSIEQLKDPAGNTTSWDHDIQGRVTKKTYADATDVDYVYETTTSRLKNVTDALNQTKNYTYYLDNSLYQVSYSNAVNATSTVTMTYDANYPRLSTAANGWGTYTYSYNNYITDPFAPAATVTMAGTNTTGDKINVTVFNSNLSGSKRNVQYTVQSGDTTSTLLATSVKNAINADGTLSAAGITATSSAAVISINAPVPLGVVTFQSAANGITTETIGGTITASDIVSITAIDSALPNGQKTLSYTVGGGDTTTTIATALKNAINADSDYTAAGITATSSAAVISITSTSSNATTYTQAVSAGATETITKGGGPTETATTGITTGAGMLATVHNNVIANSDITYLYDSLGRTTNRSINGSSNSINWLYDQMSRVTQETNALGTFNYNYVDNTAGSSKGVTRLASVNYPNGQTTKYDWFGNTGDQRLQQISNLNPSGATISQFNYRYNPAGEITQWQQLQNNTSLNYALGYDLAGQLTSATASGGPQSANYQKQYYYAYDSASNRTGVQQSSVTKVKIGGTVTTSDVLTITVVDPSISGGSQAINYTVQGGDTLNSIATALAAAITSNSNLQTLGVDASSNGSVISIKSASRDITTYTSSTSGGATETISLNVTDNFVENALIGGTKTTSDVLTIKFIDPALSGGSKSISYTVQAGDTLTTIATGIKTAINADSTLSTAGITSTSAGTVVTIRSTSPNATTYSQSVSAGATETITLSVNQNANMLVAIGGTKTTSDVITLAVYDAQLPSGVKSKTYTVQAGDNLAAIATGVTTAINGDTDLQAAGITATSSGTIITIQSNSINPTTYRGSCNTNGTETVSMGLPPNGVQTAIIGGTKTTSDVLTITVYDPGLSGGSKAINYTVLGGDTLTTIASGIASAINADTDLSTQGITATSSSTVVNIKSTSVNATTYTKSLSGGATETITLAPATNVTAYGYNNVNALTSIAPGGAALFKGTANKALKSATINSNPATLNYTEEFQGNATLSTGNNNIPVAVTDGANNTKTNNYQVVAGTGSSASPTFDANGNMTSDGTNTYAWDAENRLIQITYPGSGNNSQFTIDPAGLNVKTIENSGGTPTSTGQFIWSSFNRCEERDGSGSLIKKFFSFGQTSSGISYFYFKDHLSSIREMTDSSGNIQTQYRYELYGRVSKIQGGLDSDFQYDGYFKHPNSGLNLTLARSYNASMGRWLNRDPISENGGTNLYTYVEGKVSYLTDPTGLQGCCIDPEKLKKDIDKGAQQGAAIGMLGGAAIGGTGGTVLGPPGTLMGLGSGAVMGAGVGFAAGTIAGAGAGIASQLANAMANGSVVTGPWPGSGKGSPKPTKPNPKGGNNLWQQCAWNCMSENENNNLAAMTCIAMRCRCYVFGGYPK
ncbi:MAG: LysM peptidoglycan-binding domain-containing protein [Cyanobacteria bacterium TGS_CYA1]|nr:LysM peptidoglycan-binding domain-containing protein [Cyanobacteria bacterium TGS_CYA1]